MMHCFSGPISDWTTCRPAATAGNGALFHRITNCGPRLLTAVLLFMTATSTVYGGLPYKQQSDEEKLLDYMFQEYNPSARPVLNSSKTVNVNIQFSLLQVQELNVRTQVLKTTGLLILNWEDERLVWDEEISTLDEIVIDSKQIWRPEFATINGAEEIYGDFTEFQGVVKPKGTIRWEPGGVFKTMCQIDITYYPFDEQKCDLMFGAWSYYTTKMNLSTDKDTINLDNYEKNGEWQLVRTAVQRREFFFECCQEQRFSYIVFTIHIRRRHTFYIMNVILPGILTSCVLLSIFFCTPSQKVHIGVAALLSFRLFLLNVADTIPRTSDHVPLLGIYLTCTMAITTMAMVATVFVLNLYAMKEKPVPPWAKRVFTIYLARMLCMCNCMGLQDQYKHKEQDGAYRMHALHHNPRPTRKKYRLVGGMHSNMDGRSAGRNSSFNPETQDLLADPEEIHVPRSSTTRSVSPVRRRLYEPEDYGRPPAPPCRQPSQQDYSKEWVHVAAVCDRLFFWLCLLFICITTLLLFHPLITLKFFKDTSLENDDSTT